tara:strand:- start:1045 stop:1302 length:258 start_codon:yes stop_codon:yes gene_type:complete
VNEAKRSESDLTELLTRPDEIAKLIFEPMFESWMDEKDKKEFMKLTMEACDLTPQILADQLVAHKEKTGLSIGRQLEICRAQLAC